MCHNVSLSPRKSKIAQAIFVFICFQIHATFAQQESIRMMYPFMPMSINPAKAGSSHVANISGVYRRKPLITPPGLVGLSQQYLSFDFPIRKGEWGVGFLGFNSSQSFADGTGAIASNLGIAGVLSRRFLLAEDHELFLGANMGVNQMPVITATGSTILKGSYGLGLLYQYQQFQLGISRPSAYFEGSSRNAPIYVQGQYLMKLEHGDRLRLGVVVRTIKDLPTKIDLHGVYWFQERVGVGAWYLATGAEMGNTALLGSLQVSLGPRMMVSYAYDFLGKSLTIATPGSTQTSSNDSGSGFHQIGLRFQLDMGNGKYEEFRP
jgi:type IX secretion system PorP/SprF family membrane protein